MWTIKSIITGGYIAGCSLFRCFKNRTGIKIKAPPASKIPSNLTDDTLMYHKRAQKVILPGKNKDKHDTRNSKQAY
jgi:hypothetical protein